MHKLIGTSPADLALKKADGRTRAAHKFKLKYQSPTTTEHPTPSLIVQFQSGTNYPPLWQKLTLYWSFKSQLARRAD